MLSVTNSRLEVHGTAIPGPIYDSPGCQCCLPPPSGHRPTALLNIAHVIHARRPKTGGCLRTDNILECVFEFIISKFIIFIEN